MKKRLNILFFATILVFLGSLTYAGDTTKVKKKDWIIPDYLTFQYAGNIGAYIAGAGYKIYKDVYYLNVMYGFTSKHKAESSIHTISLMNTFKVKEFKFKAKNAIIPFAGLGVSINIGDGENTFIRLPKQFPEGYYAPNAIRVNLNFGIKYRRNLNTEKRIKALEFYIYTTTNDLYLKYYVNYRNVYFRDIFTMALGMNIFLF